MSDDTRTTKEPIRSDARGTDTEDCPALVIVYAAEPSRLGEHLLLACVPRPRRLPAARNLGRIAPPSFGEADTTGLVGESVVAWKLRDTIAFLAGRAAHVLVLGPKYGIQERDE